LIENKNESGKVKRVFEKRLGVEISELGFGAMRLPMLENGKIDRTQAAAMIDRAYAAGVNYYDTGQPYHAGESQPFLGEALKKYPRESYHFATKLPTWAIDSKETMERIFNEQLKDCGLEYFDFYLVHGLGEDRYDRFVQHGMYEYLQEQKKLGRIKFAGFSYHGNYEAYKKLLENFKWDFVMIQHNYVDDILIESGKLYDLAVKHDIPCMVMGPVRGRFLAEPPEKALAEMTNHSGDKYSPAAWALRWCREKQNIAVTISGMSSMQQVEENIKTFAKSSEKLTAEENAMLERARDIMLAIKTIPCTYCGYCMDCPAGADIPRMIEIYNQFKLFPNEFRAGVGYGKLVRDSKGYERCTNCNICSPQCPQDIDIPKALASIHEELEPLHQRFKASV